jgi:hypothetical protein
LNREFTDFGGDAAVDAEPWYYTDTEGGDVGKYRWAGVRKCSILEVLVGYTHTYIVSYRCQYIIYFIPPSNLARWRNRTVRLARKAQ